MSKCIVIVQARMGSTRLAAKMLLDLCGKPLISRVLDRVKFTKFIDFFILAVPDLTENDVLLNIAGLDYIQFKGSNLDVLDRFYNAVILNIRDIKDDDLIVRVCADNPLISSEEINRLIDFFLCGGYDFAFNNVPSYGNNYPDGLGAEILRFATLKWMWEKTTDLSHREHVTKYIWDNPNLYHFGVLHARPQIAFPMIKLDIDTQDDYKVIKKLYMELISTYGDINFTSEQVVNIYNKRLR